MYSQTLKIDKKCFSMQFFFCFLITSVPCARGALLIMILFLIPSIKLIMRWSQSTCTTSVHIQNYNETSITNKKWTIHNRSVENKRLQGTQHRRNCWGGDWRQYLSFVEMLQIHNWCALRRHNCRIKLKAIKADQI